MEEEFATVEAIAKDFQAITQQTAQMLKQSGAISQEKAVRYKKTYKNYVPLKGFEVLDEKGSRGNGLENIRQPRSLVSMR